MKTDILLDGVLGDIPRQAIATVSDADTTNFGKLVAVSGLDPKRHFRHADLRDVDFSDSDLGGFDFTGADLRGTHGVRVTWSPSMTVLTEADVEGSLFAHRLKVRATLESDEAKAMAKRVGGLGWTEQILWAMARLRNGNPDLVRDQAIAWSIFDDTEDRYLRGEILKYLEAVSPPGDNATFDLMLDLINVAWDQVHLMTKVLRILGRSSHRKDPRLRTAAKALARAYDERIVASAVEFLVSTAKSKAEIRELADLAFGRRGVQIRNSFAAALVQRLGPAYSLVARNPSTGDFRFHNDINANEMEVLTRNIERQVKSEHAAVAKGEKVKAAIHPVFQDALANNRLENKIVAMLEEMEDFGLPVPHVDIYGL